MDIIAVALIIVGLIPIVQLLIKIIFCGYKETEGYIVDYSKTESSGVDDTCINNIIEFIVEDNIYRCIDNSGNVRKLNSKVKVFYNPKDPTQCVAEINIISIFLIIAGIIIYLFTNYII